MKNWNAAQAGMDTGRNANHVIQADVDVPTNPKRKDSDKSNDLVDVILTQASYDALFADTMTKIHEAEMAVERVLDFVTARQAQDEAKLNAMVDRLPSLEDGTKVAKSENDDLIYTLDGVLVDPDEAALIPFTGLEPSLEDVLRQEQAVIEAKSIYQQVITDQNRLGEIREAMDEKPSADRLEELGLEIDAINERNVRTLETLQSGAERAPAEQRDFAIADISLPSI